METITDMLSLDECRESIKLHADNIHRDISSTFFNTNRIETLRSLLDLFEEYNEILKKEDSV